MRYDTGEMEPVDSKKTLQEHRLEKRLTQRELAKAAGLSNTAISNLERGTVRPTALTRYKIAMALNVEPNAIAFSEAA